MNKRFFLIVTVLMLSGSVSMSEDWKPLWSGGAPGAKGEADHDVPALLAFPAPQDNANGCGVVVCPGGGYGGLAMDHEGYQIVDWLNKRGISAWILRYRLGSKGYHHPIQKGDVLRAISTVRHNAKASGVDPKRVGVWGFSAGGHLASTAATHFGTGDANAADPVDKISSRPDFAVLCYPVITMEESFTHKGSRRNLSVQIVTTIPIWWNCFPTKNGSRSRLLQRSFSTRQRTRPFLSETPRNSIQPCSNMVLTANCTSIRKAAMASVSAATTRFWPHGPLVWKIGLRSTASCRIDRECRSGRWRGGFGETSVALELPDGWDSRASGWAGACG